jgi:hypothetical protein
MACEEPTNWDLEKIDHDLIVVEGLITNELKQQSITISRPTQDLNDKPEPVSGAFVAVLSEGTFTLFSEYPAGSGVYYSDSVQAVVNRVYQLYIEYDEKEYTAFAEMVPVAPLKPLSYRLADEVNMLYEISYEDSDLPSIQEYWISWAHLPGFATLPPEETLARAFHYTLASIDVNQKFSPQKEQVLFPAGSYVLRKQYSMSDEHQAFLRTFLSETEWRGSVFDVQKGNVLTNLSEGAIGFFAVSTVVSDTTVIIP